jgi:hypothetical protein
MDFPLVSNDEKCFPSNITEADCPVCGKNKLGISNECAFIHGGALALDPNDKSRLIQSDDVQGFLFFDWNGLNNQTVDFELARDVKKGQYTINFCSTKCMREFLNHCVDKLEMKIESAKNA